MKSFLKPAAAALLCCALLCPTALASDALGNRIYGYTLDICENTTLTREVMWSASRSDLRTENYVTYTPSASISPKVSFGSSVVSLQTVSSVAKDLEGNGKRVLSGINGDYYVMATGDAGGLVVTDGVLRSSDASLSAVGFNADGTAIVGSPALWITANFNGQYYNLHGINKVRNANGYFLFTEDFSANTKNTLAGVDVVLVPSGDLGIGKTVSCTVEQVIEAKGATPLPDGRYILSISSSADKGLQDALRALKPGDTVDIGIVSPDERWNNVDCAVGGLYRLITDGALNNGLDTASAAPRTAIGTKADGSVIFYTIDGRQAGHSVGATIKMVGQRLLELGCTNAVLLDGGGSTTMVATYPDYLSSTVVNKPSGGSQRSVSNAVFLVSNLSATGIPGSLYVTPSSLTLLAGASTPCKASTMDTGWYPMNGLPGPVAWSASAGSVSPDGVFTAPMESGVYTVTASVEAVSGSTAVQVYSTPDTIRVTNGGQAVSTLTLTPGQQVDLDASATYRTLPLTCQDRCFTWAADPALGSIDANGVFTAGNDPASGQIRVSAGERSVTLNVSVNAPGAYTRLADFEDDTYFTTTSEAKLSLTDAASHVALGRQALQLDYNAPHIQLAASHALSPSEKYVSLWVYGDNSGGTLSATFDRGGDTDAPELIQSLGTLNFSGWRQLTAPVPAGAASFTGLRLDGLELEHGEAASTGTLYLDQLTLANQTTPDTTAPTVKLTVNGNNVSAQITDDARGVLSQDRMVLQMDGKSLPFTWDAASATLTATLPELGSSLHQVSVTAADASGNLGRGYVTTAGSNTSNPFADMEGHWAAPFTTRLSELGIVTGVTENGVSKFLPGQSITRGDFALMAARWLGIDLADYQDVTLPYDDAAEIPPWNLDAIKALHALGIMQGSGSGGQLRANASASITRAEAMTILGRMQIKGYPQASLNGFTDAGSVPAWSKQYVASLVGQKVVSGSNGQLRPTAAVSRAEVAKMLLTMW